MKRLVIIVMSVFVLFALTGCPDTAYGNEEAKTHPLDVKLREKFEAAVTTSDMVEAALDAVKEWDKLLNENYRALMQKLDKGQQDQLRASQREWIKFRDLEFEFNASFHFDLGGTIASINIASFKWNFVRRRALELGHYLDYLEGL